MGPCWRSFACLSGFLLSLAANVRMLLLRQLQSSDTWGVATSLHVCARVAQKATQEFRKIEGPLTLVRCHPFKKPQTSSQYVAMSVSKVPCPHTAWGFCGSFCDGFRALAAPGSTGWE